MSHTAEVYAKDLGVKIGQPKITEHFIPGLPEKYITLYPSNRTKSSTYNYWQIVIFLIKPILLKEKIRIIQIGDQKEKSVAGVCDNKSGSSYKQMNYAISKALCHVGVESLTGHVSSVYDVPSVILYHNLFKENCKPLWHKENECINLEPDWSDVKPSYFNENTDINKIKPEIIAQNILDQLKIKEKINFKTILAGEFFGQEVLEVIPNFFGLNDFMKNKVLTIRGDLHHDEDIIFNYLKTNQCALHISKKIPLEKITKNLKHIIFHINEEGEDFNDYFKNFKRSQITISIYTENKDILNDLRLKYFDYEVYYNKNMDKVFNEDDFSENSKYLSTKIVISDSLIYKSISSALELDKTDKLILNKHIKQEINSLYIYE